MAWMFGYPLWIARRRTVVPHIPRLRAVFVEALLALVAAPVLLVAASVAIQVVAYLHGETEMLTSPLESIARSTDRFGRLWLVFLAVLAAPIAEEVYFRGMLYNALRQRLNFVVAALLQAVVFGLAHYLYGLAFSAGIALGGLALAAVYEWRRTLLAPVLLHASLNALGMAIMTAQIATTPQLGVY
ncbi:MAG TPA: CPBP family intramembrane glutamic endopeptidase, partial [Isosphaeraceae bacterium]|nr:CPBP family intramembrane glutamic endopeptidase [Isosphaeraceae bacterium]